MSCGPQGDFLNMAASWRSGGGVVGMGGEWKAATLSVFGLWLRENERLREGSAPGLRPFSSRLPLTGAKLMLAMQQTDRPQFASD